MRISVLNLTDGSVSDAEVQQAVRAINRQIAEDFEPYWGMGAHLRLDGDSGIEPDDDRSFSDMRGDAIIYLWNEVNVEGALAYHSRHDSGIPCAYVFVELCKLLNESWTVALSHEALELIADPMTNLLVIGPHPDPSEKNRTVFHWYEVCDAVQSEYYHIDDVAVSNFLLPLYFTGESESCGRNDFLGTVHKGSTIASFSVNPGGYIGFFDPIDGKDVTYAVDAQAEGRLKAKSAAKETRRPLLRQARGQRYTGMGIGRRRRR